MPETLVTVALPQVLIYIFISSIFSFTLVPIDKNDLLVLLRNHLRDYLYTFHIYRTDSQDFIHGTTP